MSSKRFYFTLLFSILFLFLLILIVNLNSSQKEDFTNVVSFKSPKDRIKEILKNTSGIKIIKAKKEELEFNTNDEEREQVKKYLLKKLRKIPSGSTGKSKITGIILTDKFKIDGNKAIANFILIYKNVELNIQAKSSLNTKTPVKVIIDEGDDFQINNKDYEYGSVNSVNKDIIGKDGIQGLEKKAKELSIKDEKFECLNKPEIKTKLECEDKGHVWDRPVRDSYRCPFYKANKHYPNTRGLAKGGYCEMPSGLERSGYRHFEFTKNNQPLCYNCINPDNVAKGAGKNDPKTLGTCCIEQITDQEKYPNLKGNPDYKFPGDLKDRIKHKDKFKAQGLSYN